MDERIFKDSLMLLREEQFALNIKDRMHFEANGNALFVDLSGLSLTTAAELRAFEASVERELKTYAEACGGRGLNVVANYENFDCRDSLTSAFAALLERLQSRYYASYRRIGGRAFKRAKLGAMINLEDKSELFARFKRRAKAYINARDARRGIEQFLHVKANAHDIALFMKNADSKGHLYEAGFNKAVEAFLRRRATATNAAKPYPAEAE